MTDAADDSRQAGPETPEEAWPTYAYRPNLVGGGWTFQLAPHALVWNVGGHSGQVFYDRIRHIRLSYRPMTMQSRRFVTELWPHQGPKLTIASASWRSMIEMDRQDEPYRAFITELHRRVAEAGGSTVFTTGSPPLLYWPGLAVMIPASVMIAGMAIGTLFERAWGTAAIIGGFLAFFLWQVGTFFWRNRPSAYRPDTLPERVMP